MNQRKKASDICKVSEIRILLKEVRIYKIIPKVYELNQKESDKIFLRKYISKKIWNLTKGF